MLLRLSCALIGPRRAILGLIVLCGRACAVERAADPRHLSRIDAKSLGNVATEGRPILAGPGLREAGTESQFVPTFSLTAGTDISIIALIPRSWALMTRDNELIRQIILAIKARKGRDPASP
jgi:hypothetical protein